jgi:RNA-binding protein 26
VEKIPEEHLTLEAVNNWFKRFGTVTNVAVDTKSAKALVSFSSNEEAHAAWKSQEAVFNNRFVKIFWHRPLEGQGAVGARMLQASAPVVANITRETPSAPPTAHATPSSSTPSKPLATTSSSKSALVAKQQLLEKKIAEQKELMSRLVTASPEEKKEIMARLRKLDEPMSTSDSDSKVATTSRSQPITSKSQSPKPSGDKERKAKELLDMELELHAAKTGTDEEAVTKEEDSKETTENLQEKLAKLRAEVSRLSIECCT